MTASEALQWSIFEIGGERDHERSVLVVSRESANRALPIVTALPLADHRKGRRIYPNEVLLPSASVGLSRDAVAMAHQTITVSKKKLSKSLATIEDPAIQNAIRLAMCIQLNLEDCRNAGSPVGEDRGTRR
ncbi:MAG: type II toxin-antitoxin system PemK/MazF family toxin [Holophagae bacterium]|jgi:mRNA-degrading endonuclease toxin of MazEF toxin-antitoxin module